jgi:phage terminase large subunit GpA-like protein
VIDSVSLESYNASVAASLQRCFAPWSKMPPEIWAEEVYRLPNGHRFRWSYAPYARAMFLSLFDRRTIETIFQLYSRGLKSTVILLAIGYIIDQAPRRILSLWPTNSQAEKFSKDILCGELFDTTPCLNFLSGGNRRIASNTLLHKAFPGGLIDLFGANAPGDMRRAKGSFLYADEIDAIDTTQTDEGDQLAIFAKRGSEYPDTIQVFASYPGVIGSSRINSKLQESDFNQWHSTCVRCGGEPFVMDRDQMRYEEGKPETARLECPRCKELLTDEERYAMAHLQGFDNWRSSKPFAGRRGFQANAMLWPHPVDRTKFPGGFLQMVAQQEIDAAKSDNPQRSLRVLVNTVDAEPFDPTTEEEKPPEWKPIHERRESYGLTVPLAGLFITAFADIQKNRIEVGWRAWGREEESWGMDYRVIDGYVGHPEVWNELRREFGRRFKHESGASMSLGMGFVDGGHYSEHVLAFFQGLAKSPVEGVSGHLFASKGFGRSGMLIVSRGKLASIAKNGLKGRHLGTWQAKDLVYDRLRAGLAAERGRMHYNERYDEGYFKGLTIETATKVIEGGDIFNTYKDEVTGNEPLDIEVGCLAAVRLRPRNWDELEAQLLDSIKQGPEDPEKKPASWFDGPPKPGGWL